VAAFAEPADELADVALRDAVGPGDLPVAAALNTTAATT
jgi:hypothetical protein